MVVPRVFLKLLALVFLGALLPTMWAVPKQQILHSFSPNGRDGFGPAGALIFDTSGRLYGATSAGGSTGCGGYGCGAIFGLTSKSGHWKETQVYSFSGHSDGEGPTGSLVLDDLGNLFGTTQDGGLGTYYGTAFEIAVQAHGVSNKTEIYEFCSLNNCEDGGEPWAGVIFDQSGNLYGTTFGGGPNQAGAVFELSPGSGGWTEDVLYSFNPHEGQDGTDGASPTAGLARDSSGNLYGTTTLGGNYSKMLGFGWLRHRLPVNAPGWRRMERECPAPLRGLYP